jgi:hypothetical protein
VRGIDTTRRSVFHRATAPRRCATKRANHSQDLFGCKFSHGSSLRFNSSNACPPAMRAVLALPLSETGEPSKKTLENCAFDSGAHHRSTARAWPRLIRRAAYRAINHKYDGITGCAFCAEAGGLWPVVKKQLDPTCAARLELGWQSRESVDPSVKSLAFRAFRAFLLSLFFL